MMVIISLFRPIPVPLRSLALKRVIVLSHIYFHWLMENATLLGAVNGYA